MRQVLGRDARARGRAPSTAAKPPERRTVTSIAPIPAACSMALASEVQEDLLEAAGVARTRDGAAGRREPDRRRVRQDLGDTSTAAADDRRQVDRPRLTISSWPLWMRLTSSSRSMSVVEALGLDDRPAGVRSRPRRLSPLARRRSTSWR